jgi:hypothetical protein
MHAYIAIILYNYRDYRRSRAIGIGETLKAKPGTLNTIHITAATADAGQ